MKITQLYNQIKIHRPINQLDIYLFWYQLTTLITAGFPILKCCETLERSQYKIALRLLIYTIKNEILAGKTLFQSLSNYPQYFNNLVCQLIKLAEQTGKIDDVLAVIIQYYEKNMKLKKQIKQIIFYPCCILISALIMLVGLFIFIIPHFAELFKSLPTKLPFITIAIFKLADFINHFYLLLLFVTFSLILLAIYLQCKKNILKKLSFHIPLIKSYIAKITYARFTRNLALTFAAGVPIVQALNLLADSYDHSEQIAQLRLYLDRGAALHHAMALTNHFPAFLVHMVKIGEESGKLDIMLNKIADIFEQEIDQFNKHFMTLLEPLIMISLGVLIGIIVIAMYLPLFKLGNLS